VNSATAIVLALAAIFGVGDWIACARRATRLEYFCKPATLVALIAAACALDPAADAETRRLWFVAALVASLAGDVLLMLPRDLFVGGLAAFLVAHVCYVAGFWTDAPGLLELLVAAAVTVVIVVPLARRILGALAGEPELRPPVGAYIAVISAMLASALASGNVVAAAGAALFVASDSMIAWNRFVRPFPAAPVAIMVTYHLGQAGLVLSLL
jgi:uncharacterized membrane protein YhhN